ncbi:MAG TPA: hypothetical protein VLQ93_21800, partial [Myxococcaceae bacterium]|nr:hypothetical protein [Myxococcaceae bacterium]
MREGPLAVLLAVLLCAGAALATEVAVPATEVAVPAPEEYREESSSEPGYQEVGGSVETLADGVLRVSVQESALRPPRGYTPVAVTLHNKGATPRVVRLGFETSGSGRGEVASREVEVGPRQRLVTWLHIPATVRYGRLWLRGADEGPKNVGVFLGEREGAAMVLGAERDFESGTGLRRVKEPQLWVRFIEPGEAPRELAAYVGHRAVVVAGEVTAVPADVWAALEAYAVTGGRLTLLRPPRDVGERLPLLEGTESGLHPYGLGEVRLCASADECGWVLLEDVRKEAVPVEPGAPAHDWERGRSPLRDGLRMLLPGVRAPVGRFLLLIFLFVLAVGPGGLVLARRKGPVAVLVAVPVVALVTCLSIIAWAVLVEGFATHAARYSLTWLDRERARAVTVGVGGYYANLAPDGVRLPGLSVLLAPAEADASQYAPVLDWTRGLEVKEGFLPARVYREWGEVAV